MSEISLRRAKIDDASALLNYLKALTAERHPGLIHRETFPTLEQEREWLRARVDREDAACWVITKGDEIVGLAEVDRGKIPQTAHCATIGISMLASLRGQGLGQRLMGLIHDWGRAHPTIQRVQLKVFSTNPGAIRFYERLGYQHEGRQQAAFIQGDIEIDVIDMAFFL